MSNAKNIIVIHITLIFCQTINLPSAMEVEDEEASVHVSPMPSETSGKVG